MAKGYTHREGIDFIKTYSPVEKLTITRIILTIVVVKEWYLEQLDVDNAFLYGELIEEVYMEVPPEVTNPRKNQVCHLTKSL